MTHFQPQARCPRIDPVRASYRDSCQTTVILFAWAEKKHDPQLGAELNRAMREGKLQMEIFKERTGKTVDELWAEFVATVACEARVRKNGL